MPVNVQGSNYREAMKQYTPLLVERAKGVIAAKGRITAVDIGIMAIELDLPFKTAFDFLGYAEIIYSGVWDRKKFTAKELKKAIEQLAEKEAIAQ